VAHIEALIRQATGAQAAARRAAEVSTVVARTAQPNRFSAMRCSEAWYLTLRKACYIQQRRPIQVKGVHPAKAVNPGLMPATGYEGGARRAGRRARRRRRGAVRAGRPGSEAARLLGGAARAAGRAGRRGAIAGADQVTPKP